MRSINIYGNHRGGTEVVTRLPQRAQDAFGPRWILADPKPGRARLLAELVRQRFPETAPTAREEEARVALSQAGSDDVLVLTMDTVRDTRAVLEARRQSQIASYQMVGRGPGGPRGIRVAVAGTVLPADRATDASVRIFMGALERISQPRSSTALTSDAMTGLVLAPLRSAVARRTAEHLLELDRAPDELTGGPLSVALNATLYPLVIAVARPTDQYHHRTALAVDAAGRVPVRAWQTTGSGSGAAVVAVVVPETDVLELITVSQTSSGQRRVVGLTEFSVREEDRSVLHRGQSRQSAPVSSTAVFSD